MRVEVDRSRCESYGFCVDAAPALFSMDDESGDLIVEVAEVPEDERATAEAAVRVCPVAALTLEG